MKSHTAILIIVLALALPSCAVSLAPPSKTPTPSTALSPLIPTAFVVASSPLPTPPPAATLAPDFSLPREGGQAIRLSDFRGKSSVVLVFYRGQT